MRRLLPLLLLGAPLAAQAPAPDPLAPVRFLVGSWAGEGSGRPGPAAGEATFSLDLGGRVLVRRSHAQGPSGRHEDCTTVYPEGGGLKALYVDNEGHVIHYAVTASADAVVFLSEPAPGPRFRLTYRRQGADALALSFDIAPPGRPEAFSAYLQATLHRKP